MMTNYLPNQNVTKNRQTDVVLKLKPIEGKFALNTAGLVDKRLFTGENSLHMIMDPNTCHWSFKMDAGKLPEAFHQSFTGFQRGLQFAKDYYLRRNIEIIEIVD